MAPSPKIFGIGFSRTGTTSLTKALRLLGFDTVHFPKDIDEILAHEAATDMPVAGLYRELDRAFPHSKFILTVRDRESWLRSCERHWRRHADYFASEPTLLDLYERLLGSATFDATSFAEAAERHEHEVRAHFADRPGQLLVMNPVAGDGWEVLCPFLGRRVPRLPFPSTNASTAYEGLIRRLLSSTGDVAWVAETTAVTSAYVEEAAKAAPDDPATPLPLDDGDDFRISLAQAERRFGSRAALAEALGHPIETITALLERDTFTR